MFAKLIDLITTLYSLAFVVRWVIQSFLPQYEATGWFLKLKDVTEPVVQFIRKIVPPLKGIDFTYLIAVVGVKLIANVFITLFF